MEEDARRMEDTRAAGDYLLLDKSVWAFFLLSTHRLGKGAFGTVYRGLHKDTGSTAAVKVIRLKGLRASQRLLEAQREVELLSGLDHSNIVHYITSSQTPTQLVVAMEFMEGGSLARMVNRYGRLPERLARLFTAQVLQGLVYLHNQGVIHRDVKGANLLCDKDGRVKLADFGLATVVRGDGTSDDVFTGSVFWMAPEAIDGGYGYGAKSDVWSVGATVLELVSGRPPHGTMQPHAACYRIVNDAQPPPLPDDLSHDLISFLTCCFQHNPDNRPDAEELLHHAWLQEIRTGPPARRITDETTTRRRSLSSQGSSRWQSLLNEVKDHNERLAKEEQEYNEGRQGGGLAAAIVAAVASGNVKVESAPVVAVPKAAPSLAMRGWLTVSGLPRGLFHQPHRRWIAIEKGQMRMWHSEVQARSKAAPSRIIPLPGVSATIQKPMGETPKFELARSGNQKLDERYLRRLFVCDSYHSLALWMTAFRGAGGLIVGAKKEVKVVPQTKQAVPEPVPKEDVLKPLRTSSRWIVAKGAFEGRHVKELSELLVKASEKEEGGSKLLERLQQWPFASSQLVSTSSPVRLIDALSGSKEPVVIKRHLILCNALLASSRRLGRHLCSIGLLSIVSHLRQNESYAEECAKVLEWSVLPSSRCVAYARAAGVSVALLDLLKWSIPGGNEMSQRVMLIVLNGLRCVVNGTVTEVDASRSVLHELGMKGLPIALVRAMRVLSADGTPHSVLHGHRALGTLRVGYTQPDDEELGRYTADAMIALSEALEGRLHPATAKLCIVVMNDVAAQSSIRDVLVKGGGVARIVLWAIEQQRTLPKESFPHDGLCLRSIGELESVLSMIFSMCLLNETAQDEAVKSDVVSLLRSLSYCGIAQRLICMVGKRRNSGVTGKDLFPLMSISDVCVEAVSSCSALARLNAEFGEQLGSEEGAQALEASLDCVSEGNMGSLCAVLSEAADVPSVRQGLSKTTFVGQLGKMLLEAIDGKESGRSAVRALYKSPANRMGLLRVLDRLNDGRVESDDLRRAAEKEPSILVRRKSEALLRGGLVRVEKAVDEDVSVVLPKMEGEE